MSGTHHPFSPSRLAMRAACPASFRMEEGTPESTSEFAAEGTMLHAVMANHFLKKPIEHQLTSEQEELVTYCLLQVPECQERHVEKKMYLQGTRPDITNGTADLIVTQGDGRALLIDWKFGRSEVEEAANNLQMAAYAVMAADKYHFQEVEAMVVQPRLNKTTRYVFREFDAIRALIEEVIDVAMSPDAPANVGEACRYCRGKDKCRAFRGEAEFPLKVQKRHDLNELAPVGQWPDDDLVEFHYRAGLLNELAGIVDKEMRHRCELNGSCGDYIIKVGSGIKSVSDTLTAWKRLACAEKPMSMEGFASACKLSIPKLSDAFKTLHGGSSVKARSTIEQTLGDAITEGKPIEKLERRKAEKIELAA